MQQHRLKTVLFVRSCPEILGLNYLGAVSNSEATPRGLLEQLVETTRLFTFRFSHDVSVVEFLRGRNENHRAQDSKQIPTFPAA